MIEKKQEKLNFSFCLGDSVKVKGHRLVGIILQLKDKLAVIQTEGKILTVSIDQLEKTDFFVKPTITVHRHYEPKEQPNEIMLRHKNVDIAIYELDCFIMNSIVNDVLQIRIVHGKQGGVLRHAVHEYLKHNKQVTSFRLGNYFEGQYGVTIAILKKH